MMLEKLKIFENNDKIEENESTEPIDKEYIEKAIKLVKIAKDIDCDFELYLKLAIHNFSVSNGSFDDIKLVNNKKKTDELLIQYHDMLMFNDVRIPIDNIININLQISYNGVSLQNNKVNEDV